MIQTERPVNARTLGLPDIALVGKAGSGKSTGADLLVELGYQKLSFAAPLKDIAVQLWGPDAATDRRLLQGLGVAVREIEPDTWVDLLIQARRERFTKALPVVVDDLRFENEWDALKAEGFVIVRVEAPTSSRVDRLKGNGKWQDESQLDHVSETAVDHLEPDYVITNDGSTDEYYEELVNVLLKERWRR